MRLLESEPRVWHCRSIRRFVRDAQFAGMLFVNQRAGSARLSLQMLQQPRGPSEYTRQADGRTVRAPPRAQVEGMPRTPAPTT